MSIQSDGELELKTLKYKIILCGRENGFILEERFPDGFASPILIRSLDEVFDVYVAWIEGGEKY